MGPFDLVACKYGIEIFKPDYIAVTSADRLFSLPQNLSTQFVEEYLIEKDTFPQDVVNSNFTGKI